jgi:hypothetical protein
MGDIYKFQATLSFPGNLIGCRILERDSEVNDERIILKPFIRKVGGECYALWIFHVRPPGSMHERIFLKS